MNQFRDITMVTLIILALGVSFSDPDDWTWASRGPYIGPYLVNALHFLAICKPWSPIVLLALALALFMTRIKY
jgi:hypothetical protein